jgi:hypothetical protein
MSIMDKMKNLLGQHGDKVDKVVEKAGDMVDHKTGASSASRAPVNLSPRAAPASTCQGARPAASKSAARTGSRRDSAPVSASARARATSASKPIARSSR